MSCKTVRDAGCPNEPLARLIGMQVPDVALRCTTSVNATTLSLAEIARLRSLVVTLYCNLSPVSTDLSADPEVARLYGWGHGEAALAEWGYLVVAVTAQSVEDQAAVASYDLLNPNFAVPCMLSDVALDVARELRLPLKAGSDERQMYEPLTMLVNSGRVSSVFHPVCAPADEPATVIAHIRKHYL
jgi:peroxiredoxin